MFVKLKKPMQTKVGIIPIGMLIRLKKAYELGSDNLEYFFEWNDLVFIIPQPIPEWIQIIDKPKGKK